MKGSVVNFAGGSFCWNYGTDTLYGNYTGDNVCYIYADFCYIYADFEVALSVTGMLVELSVAIMQVTVSAANMWVTVFIVIMHVGVSISELLCRWFLSVVDYAHNSFYCN